jgi:hypothetical protein
MTIEPVRGNKHAKDAHAVMLAPATGSAYACSHAMSVRDKAPPFAGQELGTPFA